MPTLVFDLDGTLVDSASDLAGAASELVEGLGGAPLDVATVTTMVGDGAPLLVQRALSHAGLDPQTPGALDRFLAIYERRLVDRTRPYDGIPEVLSLLVPRGPLAVLTNKPAKPTAAVLDALGLRGFFSFVVGGDTSYGRKPEPAALRYLLARSDGIGVLIGDSPVDARTATAAGCPFVLAGWGFGVAKFTSTRGETGAAGAGAGGTEGPPLQTAETLVPDTERQDVSPDDLPAGTLVARHPRELISLIDTLTFDAARMPIVMR